VRFSEIQHQNEAIGRLQRAIALDKLPHAYLFSGQSGVGKERTALALASVRLCSNPSPTGQSNTLEACGVCDDCRLVEADNHPDVRRIHRGLNKFHPDKTVQRRKAIELSVDVIRHFLVDAAGTAPSRGAARFFIVVDADRMNNNAQNALLKTLEEPPARSHLILLTSSTDELLPTIRSRCQTIAFRSLPVEFVRDRLVKDHQIEPKSAAFLAELAHGSLGSAIRYSQTEIGAKFEGIVELVLKADSDPLGAGKGLMDVAKELSSSFKDEAVAEDEDTNASREAQTLVLAATSLVLRDVQRRLLGLPVISTADETAIDRLTNGKRPARVGRAIKAVGLAENQIDQNAYSPLVFDSLGMALAMP
jgi:DNA polymerase III delta' subunit